MVDLVIGNGTNATTGASSYVYIRYASDASGTGLSETPDVGLDYIAVKSTNTEIASPVAGDFTGLWFNWKGAPGGAVTSVLNGVVDPTTEGGNGDFYINTTTMQIFGPKASGTWPAGVSMIGQPGATGATGAAGANGSNGTNGNTILSGAGAPSNGTGNNGDSYIDTTNKVFYYNKTAGTWPNSFSMLGDTGAAGADGNTILYGAGAPSNGTGNNGDSYYDTTNKVFYANKASGIWPAGSSLVGPAGSNGSNGTNGNTILYGSGAPSNALGNNGDTYIDTTNKVAYFNKAAGLWPAGASLVGNTGATGATGSTGATGAQGDRPGLKYNFSTTTTMADPTSTFFRINAGNTQMVISDNGVGPIDHSAFILFHGVGSTAIIKSNTNSDTSMMTIDITGITDNSGYTTIDYTVLSGSNNFTNNEVCAIEFYQGFVSAETVNTIANLPTPTGNTDLNAVVRNPGNNGATLNPSPWSMYCDGTRWHIHNGKGTLAHKNTATRVTCPGVQAASIANNGGNVQINATAHGLTSTSVGASIYVSAGTGWTAGFYTVLSIDTANAYTVDTTFTGKGTPTVSLNGTDIEVNSPTIPPLYDDSCVYVDVTVTCIALSTSTKRIKLNYGGTYEFLNVNLNGATNSAQRTSAGFSNRSLTSQIARSTLTSGSGFGPNNSSYPIAGTVSSGSAVDLKIILNMANANDPMEVSSWLVEVVL